MLIRIWKASNRSKKPCKDAYLEKNSVLGKLWMVKIDTLDDLKRINEECKVPLVINFVETDYEEKEIIIYDDYIE